MCECGCVESNERYTLPAPDGELYLITLAQFCRNCAASSGITIERIRKGTHDWNYIHENEGYIDGPLPLEKWASGNDSVGIITGMEMHEFIEAAQGHLTDLDKGFFSDSGGTFDDAGAEVVLEEMYDDVQVKPHLPKTQGA